MFVTCPHCGVHFEVPSQAPTSSAVTSWLAQCTKCTGLFEVVNVPTPPAPEPVTHTLPPPYEAGGPAVFGMVPIAGVTPKRRSSAIPIRPAKNVLEVQPRELPAEAHLNRRQSPHFPLTYREFLLQGVVLPAPLMEGKAMVRGRLSRPLLELLQGLPKPWLAVRPEPSGHGYVAERLVGVSASSAARELARQKRVFPLGVWLRLADVMLEGLEGLPAGATAPFRLHPLWTMWAGPHAVSATIDRRLVMTAGPMGLPALAREVPPITSTWAMRGGRTDPFGARRALRWLLDPGLPLSGPDLETRVPRHPHATRELFRALGQTPSLGAMRDALKALWPATPPASEQDAATFVLTACPDLLAMETKAASSSPHVPPEWKQGALQVLADQLLDAGPVLASVGKELELATLNELRTRVMLDGLCIYEGRAEAVATLQSIAFFPANPLDDGQWVTVVLEHGGRHDGVRLVGTVRQGRVVFDEVSDQQRAQLEQLLAG